MDIFRPTIATLKLHEENAEKRNILAVLMQAVIVVELAVIIVLMVL